MKINFKNIVCHGRTFADYLEYAFDKKTHYQQEVPCKFHFHSDKVHLTSHNKNISVTSIDKTPLNKKNISICLIDKCDTRPLPITIYPVFFKEKILCNCSDFYIKNKKILPNEIFPIKMFWNIFDETIDLIKSGKQEKRIIKLLFKKYNDFKIIKKEKFCNKNYISIEKNGKIKIITI